MLLPPARTRMMRLRQVAATMALLSMSASLTPALAKDRVKLITKDPTTQQECDAIFGKVIEALMIETDGEGLAIQHFLIGTQADRVLADLCAKQNYKKAADFANAIIDGDPKPPQKKNPNAGRDCFLDCR